MVEESPNWPSDAVSESLDLVLSSRESPSLTFLDVGAHEGETLEFVAHKVDGVQLTYHGFEPNPVAFDKLQALAVARGAGANMTIHSLAVGAVSASVDFRVMKASAVSGVLPAEEELLQRVPQGDHLVEDVILASQVSLDDFVTQEKVGAIDVLKIDTEGYELEVLQGCQELLGKGGVSVVVAESFFVRYRVGQAYFWDLASFLHTYGYFFYGLRDTRETSQGRLYTGNGIWVSGPLGEKLGFF